jgi:hypothetical protein
MQDTYSNLTGAEWGGIGTGILGTAGTYFGSVEQRKAAQAQAEALRQQGLTQLEIARVQQQTKLAELEALKSGAGATTGAGSKTLYIALGVGAVVVLGVVIFAVTRK